MFPAAVRPSILNSTNSYSSEEFVFSIPLYENPWTYTLNYPLKAFGAHVFGPFFVASKVAVFALKLLYDFCILLPNSYLKDDYDFFYLKAKCDLVAFGGFLIKMIPLIGPYLGFSYDKFKSSLVVYECPLSDASSVGTQELEDSDQIRLEDRLLNIYHYMRECRIHDAKRSIDDLREDLGSFSYQIDSEIDLVCSNLIKFIEKNIEFSQAHPMMVGFIPKKEKIKDIKKKFEEIEKSTAVNNFAKLKRLIFIEITLLEQGLSYFEDQFGDTDLKLDMSNKISILKKEKSLSLESVLKIYEMQMDLEEKWSFYNELRM